MERGKPEYLEERKRTNNKLNLHIVSTPGFQPGPHWSEASALCHPCSLKSCWYSTGWKVVLKDPFKKAWGQKPPAPPPSTDSLQTSGKLMRLPGFAKEMIFNIWFVFVLDKTVFRLLVFVFFSHSVKIHRTTACKSQFSLKQYITYCLLSGTLD